MPVVVDDPSVGLLEREDFERAWPLDASAPRRTRIIPDTTIVVSRHSPHDFQDRQIPDRGQRVEDADRMCGSSARQAVAEIDRTNRPTTGEARVPHGKSNAKASLESFRKLRAAGEDDTGRLAKTPAD